MVLKSQMIPVLDAVAAIVLSAAVGLLVNCVRGDGLTLVASVDYEIFVPCPEPLGEVKALEAGAVLPGGDRSLLVDAREGGEYERWHLEGAISVEFDYLAPVPTDTVKKLARTGAAAIVVYGDGGDPDSGREMARELAGRGLRNVYWVRGGAKALADQDR